MFAWPWSCLSSDLIFTHWLFLCMYNFDQPPRLISMQQLPRGPGGMNGGPGPPIYPSSHHMRLPGPPQGRMPTAQPRLNGQQYPPMMQPQLQRQVSTTTLVPLYGTNVILVFYSILWLVYKGCFFVCVYNIFVVLIVNWNCANVLKGCLTQNVCSSVIAVAV